MHFPRRWLCLIAALVPVLAAFCVAQSTGPERKGQITGRVTDSTHAALQGAQLEVLPAGQVIASDSQGQFTIAGLTPGRYTLTVSYVGFARFFTEVSVAAGIVTHADVILHVEARSEEITVDADREYGEVGAINRQRTADNMLQVLPAEVISSLPNTNVADAVGRLPGVSLERDEGEGKYVQIRGTEPRLSNVTIDGVHLAAPEGVRNVKLDVIPADLIDSVEVSKTLSANQEADAIGGSVNLVSKRAHDDPYLSLLAMGGYTPVQRGRWLDQFTATAGQRFGKNKRLGILLGGSFDWNERGIYDIQPGQVMNPLSNGQSFAGPVTLDIRDFWYDRTRYGSGGTLDYKLGDFSSVYVRGLFSRFHDFGEEWFYSPTVGTFDTANGAIAVANANGTTSFTHAWHRPQQRIFNMATGARHDLGATVIVYDFSLGQGRQIGCICRAIFLPKPNTPLSKIKFSVDTSDPLAPQFQVLNGANLYDPSAHFLSLYRRRDTHDHERDVTGSLAVIRQYNLGTHYGSFEIGSKARDGRKSQLDMQHFFNGNLTLPFSSVLGSFSDRNYYFGKYQFGPTSDWNRIVALVNANLGSSITEDKNKGLMKALLGDFVTSERVWASYLMNTINIGPVRLQTGLRMEATDGSFTGDNALVTKKTVTGALVRGDHDYVNLLPSAQLQYTFGENKVRAAYGMGIARPNVADLPPFSAEDDVKKTVSLGNPDLLPTRANNYDVSFERYLKPAGMIQFGAFYKDLHNPIYENVETDPTTGPLAGFKVFQPINGRRAHIQGIEMMWQQHLSFLPGLLNGTGVRATYSLTRSQVSFPAGFGRSDHPRLLREAPNNWNLDLTYDKKGFTARIGTTHNDANIYAYHFVDGAAGGIRGPNGDTYLYPHTQLDAQTSYWIPRGHGLQAVVSLLNLTNEVFGFYQGSERFPMQREFYSRTISVGLRWRLTREPK